MSPSTGGNYPWPEKTTWGSEPAKHAYRLRSLEDWLSRSGGALSGLHALALEEAIAYLRAEHDSAAQCVAVEDVGR
jgi:hypothetical protein